MACFTDSGTEGQEHLEAKLKVHVLHTFFFLFFWLLLTELAVTPVATHMLAVGSSFRGAPRLGGIVSLCTVCVFHASVDEWELALFA